MGNIFEDQKIDAVKEKSILNTDSSRAEQVEEAGNTSGGSVHFLREEMPNLEKQFEVETGIEKTFEKFKLPKGPVQQTAGMIPSEYDESEAIKVRDEGIKDVNSGSYWLIQKKLGVPA